MSGFTTGEPRLPGWPNVYIIHDLTQAVCIGWVNVYIYTTTIGLHSIGHMT
jgi:hypothetical protein